MKDLNDDLYRLSKNKVRQWMRLYECLTIENTAGNIHHSLNCLYFILTQCHEELDELMDKYAELHGYEKLEDALCYTPIEQGGEE